MRPTFNRAASALALLALSTACTRTDTTSPLSGPSLNLIPAEGAKVRVCKDATAPAGDFSFTVSQSGGRGGTLLAGNAFTLSAGECVDVWQALADPPSSDPLVTVTVTEVSLPSGVQFDSATAAVDDPNQPVTPGDAAMSVGVNYYHGGSITFFNSAEPSTGLQGCTPGYWKNHTDSWPSPYAAGDDFDATFGVNAFNPNITLLGAAKLGGGGLNKLARHAVAALLSSASIDYPQSTADVIAAVAAAISSGAYEPLATQLDTWNNLGCPLN